MPGTEVLVPLPLAAFAKTLLRVETALMQVDLITQQLPHWQQHSGQLRQEAESLAELVRTEDESSRALLAPFAHDLWPLSRQQIRHLVLQDLRLVRLQQSREEQVSPFVELGDLCDLCVV